MLQQYLPSKYQPTKVPFSPRNTSSFFKADRSHRRWDSPRSLTAICLTNRARDHQPRRPQCRLPRSERVHEGFESKGWNCKLAWLYRRLPFWRQIPLPSRLISCCPTTNVALLPAWTTNTSKPGSKTTTGGSLPDLR
jgi:hypothetical protein